MSPYNRGMIFATFLGASLCIVLLAVALGTQYWVVAQAKRAPERQEINFSNRSEGRVHFGLFSGQKEMNVGYGLRQNHFNLADLVAKEPDFLHVALWRATTYCIYFSLLLSVLSAIFAVVNTAITPVRDLFGIPGLYVWNSTGIIFQIVAVSCWVAEFLKKLRFNVIEAEDRKLYWTSEDMAYLGYSFWLIPISILVQLLNLGFIYSGTSEMRHKKSAPAVEEKTNGAIMLY